MPKLYTIQDIDESYLSGLIQNLLSKKLYRSEAQLQFDIALQLKSDLTNVSDSDVLLEYVSSTTKVDSKFKRLYTDIIVYDKKDKAFIPIELKYKTKKYEEEGVELLKDHGARDLACYDFWWDTKRIELLKKEKSKLSHKNFPNYFIREPWLQNFVKGFAVMVTNDKSYQREHKKSCAKEFCLNSSDGVGQGKTLNWINNRLHPYYENTWRDMPLIFDTQYPCKWLIDIKSPAPYNTNFGVFIVTV